MVGIAEVARAAGVSPATASRALTGRGYVAAATRDRVARTARELGYVASRSAANLVTGRTQTVAVLVPTLSRWFFAEVVEGAQSALWAEGHELALYAAAAGTPVRTEVFDALLSSKRFDGIVAVGIEPDSREEERLAAFGRPVVGVGAHSVAVPSVGIDDAATARVAAEHLVELGHRDICFIGGPPDGGSHGDRQRVAGAQAALHEAGLPVPMRVIDCASTTTPDGFAAAGAVLADRRTRPTALVAVCDEVAVGASIAARRLGIRVPADLSIVGIDDHPMAEMFSLTTMRQRPREQGERAVQLLMRGIRHPDAAPDAATALTQLVVRGSTAEPRTAARG
ncbi:LacI family DNA-binding transcriptional regulator [Microbacterium luticocti]|uniref:LacI family DNA-binding transcriptional regulator n=1 Tax=Microbacterium luticocti TaxID=451764 RepID=UPI00041D8E1E|nr:LacI family DNA-binding transcriptional regulator [Microbacterium luticocti]